MNEKRKLITLSFIFVIFALSLSTIVSAQYGSSPFSFIDLGQGMRQLIDQAINFFTPVFEIVIGDYSGSEFFFTKVMLLLLLFVVIYFVLDHVPLFQGYRGINYIVALIVSIIAVRFISENQLVLGILLPYGTLGVALTTILPFFIFAYFIHTTGMPGIARKLCWIFFGIVFLVLWIYKADQIGDIGNQIYFWTTIAMAIMLILDKRIHAYFRGLDIKRFEQDAHENEIANLQIELRRLITMGGATPSQEIKNQIRKMQRRIRHLGGKYE